MSHSTVVKRPPKLPGVSGRSKTERSASSWHGRVITAYKETPAPRKRKNGKACAAIPSSICFSRLSLNCHARPRRCSSVQFSRLFIRRSLPVPVVSVFLSPRGGKGGQKKALEPVRCGDPPPTLVSTNDHHTHNGCPVSTHSRTLMRMGHHHQSETCETSFCRSPGPSSELLAQARAVLFSALAAC